MIVGVGLGVLEGVSNRERVERCGGSVVVECGVDGDCAWIDAFLLILTYLLVGAITGGQVSPNIPTNSKEIIKNELTEQLLAPGILPIK